MWFFGHLGFPQVILVNKPMKALYLSFKMVYQRNIFSTSFLCEVIDIWSLPKVKLIFQWEFWRMLNGWFQKRITMGQDSS